MTSDEKRREIAVILREEFGQGQCQWSDLFRDMLAEILECNETLDGAPLYDQMAEKLADLIDRPTRRLDLTDVETHGNVKVRIYECSRCGRTCEDVYGKYERCPHCGGVVVEDD